MTSPDTPDTGAGTPLTAEERLRRLHPRDTQLPLNAYAAGTDRYHVGCAVAEYLAAFDAARSRPATDPAGLDVALREVEQAARAADHGSIDDGPAWAAGARWAAKWIADATAARLSVADGPGPEERPE